MRGYATNGAEDMAEPEGGSLLVDGIVCPWGTDRFSPLPRFRGEHGGLVVTVRPAKAVDRWTASYIRHQDGRVICGIGFGGDPMQAIEDAKGDFEREAVQAFAIAMRAA